MVSLKQLYEWFTTGKYPTEIQFQEQFKSFWHKSERMPLTQVLGLVDFINKAATKEDLANATTNFKGYHTSLAELLIAHPQNENKKDFYAWVGSPYPGTVWKVFADGGAWTDTGEIPTQQEIELAEYLKKKSVTVNITNEKETVPSNFAVNSLQNKLYGNNEDSVVFMPSSAIIGKVINENGQLINNANGRTTGLVNVKGGDELTFNAITNVVRLFDSANKLVIELPNTTVSYIVPMNAVFVATNDVTNNSEFCTITVKKTTENTGDIPRLEKELQAVDTSNKVDKQSFYNVSQESNEFSFVDKNAARKYVPNQIRSFGQTLFYQLADGTWIREQFIGSKPKPEIPDGVIFTPDKVKRNYTTETDGSLLYHSDAKYGTTDHIEVVEGAKINIENITVKIIRFFNSSKQLISEIKDVDECIVPTGAKTMSLNDNVGNALFCTVKSSGTQPVKHTLMTPNDVKRNYTTEADGSLKYQSDAKYGTTGLVNVVEGATIEIIGKTYDLIRLFNLQNELLGELQNVDEFVVPENVAFIALNDNVNSSNFCTIYSDKQAISDHPTESAWLSDRNWQLISNVANDLLNKYGFKTSVNIDDFEGTDIEKINSSIEYVHLSGGGVVEINRDVLIDESIIMRSNVFLLFDATIKVADYTFDNIIRMAGVVPDPAKPNDKCLELNETNNIKVLGIGSNARIEGCDIPYKGINPKTNKEEDFVGDYFGWRTISILLSNVKDYEVGNFYMTKTKCWAISQEWGCENGYVHDIEFNTSVKNGDGVNCRNGCKNIVIENITGSTSDDMVACTALDMSFAGATGGGNYVWVLQTMGFNYKTDDEAGIFNITIKNLDSKGYETVRLLATSPKVQNISISNVRSQVSMETVIIHTGYGNGFVKGNLKDVYINNVTRIGGGKAINCTAPLIDGWFNKISGTVYVDSNAENVKVTNN